MKLIEIRNDLSPISKIWAGQYICYGSDRKGCGSIIQIDDDLDVNVCPDLIGSGRRTIAIFSCPNCRELNEVTLEDKLMNPRPYVPPKKTLWERFVLMIK